MLKVLRLDAADFQTTPPEGCEGWRLPDDAVWIDLLHPTREEELHVEAFLGIPLPTRDDMVEIEPSSRLYQENGATVMTASVLFGVDQDVPSLEPVTFVVSGARLVTIRYCDPKAFRVFAAHVGRQGSLFTSGPVVFVHLLEAIIDRIADILEQTGAEVDAVSRTVFSDDPSRRFEPLLMRLGQAQNINLKARESLVSFARVVSFCSLAEPLERTSEARELLASQERDVRSLTDHSAYIASNVAFLLDAALGLISLQQNQIIKVFSLFTVCLMPPTLIGAIYGMNFDHMPELRVAWAYPATLLAMLAAGAAPLFWFKRRGWL